MKKRCKKNPAQLGISFFMFNFAACKTMCKTI